LIIHNEFGCEGAASIIHEELFISGSDNAHFATDKMCSSLRGIFVIFPFVIYLVRCNPIRLRFDLSMSLHPIHSICR